MADFPRFRSRLILERSAPIDHRPASVQKIVHTLVAPMFHRQPLSIPGFARSIVALVRSSSSRTTILLTQILFYPVIFNQAVIALAQSSTTPITPRPVLQPEGKLQAAPHGKGNIYAPDVHEDAGRFRMWFGAQANDGHDRIHLAESENGATWKSLGVVLEDSDANHVNDPSVVKVDGKYWMYYTRATEDIRDEIAVATSLDGVHWTDPKVVLRPSPAPHWDSLLVGRPSVLYENRRFRMWYDGRKDLPAGSPASNVPTSDRSVRAVGYAESIDGIHWTKQAEEPVYGNDAGGVHVSRIGNRYLMLYESREGTRWATSQDGIAWTNRGLLVARSGTPEDLHGHVTPFLFQSQKGGASLFVGAARSFHWDQNAIAQFDLPDFPSLLKKIP